MKYFFQIILKSYKYIMGVFDTSKKRPQITVQGSQ